MLQANFVIEAHERQMTFISDKCSLVPRDSEEMNDVDPDIPQPSLL